MVACGLAHVDSTRAPDAVLDAARRTGPDVIVVDIEVAGSMGVGLVPALHQVSPESMIIVLSQFESLRFASLAAGADAFIGKADLRELRRCLERVTGG